MKQRFKVDDEKAMHCRFHVQTGGSTLTAQQVENNIVRTTIQALAAILGGAQSLHTNSFDEALGLPTDHSATIALRTQQIIAHESEIVNYIDPLGNSDQIEELTKKLIVEAEDIINKIDELGGASKAIEKGWIQNEISKSAYSYQQSVDKKERIIVGLNKFNDDEDSEISLQKIDNSIVQRQIKKIETFKNNRDNSSVQNKIDELKLSAKTNDNLIPSIIDAARADCTIGEIADALRYVFGEHSHV